MKLLRGSCLLLALLLLPSLAWADDAFYDLRVADLKITQGSLTDPTTQPSPRGKRWEMAPWMQPSVTLDGEGEGYLTGVRSGDWPRDLITVVDSAGVVLRAPAGKDITGRLVLPKGDLTGMRAVRFTIPASAATAAARAAFLKGKVEHYSDLAQRDLPGTAWFRHQVRQAQSELNGAAAAVDADTRFNPRRPSDDDFEGAFDLFSGGRAISENLQLDRVMPPNRNGRPATQPATVDISTISGITVRAMDWTKLLGAQKPKLDALASMIPADQHAVFLPSFAAAAALADEMDRQSTPILQYAAPRSEDAGTVKRYEHQLCLSLSGLSRLLGPQVITSMAITGSDPYFMTGTDIAILFEAKDAQTLGVLLSAQMSLASAGNPQARAMKGETGPPNRVSFLGMVSPDRSICVYLATIGNTVIITNSLVQLDKLAAASKGQDTIATLPEYQFFRQRYALGDASESAFIFISDATIRRWCGPRWRIASYRRTVAQAVLTELQAQNLDALAGPPTADGIQDWGTNGVAARPLTPPPTTLDMGELALTSQGVRSTIYGSPEFLTPICELNMDKVTNDEAQSYNRWRDGYQRNWSWSFDPIGLRLGVGPEKLAADLSIMPLIASTDYREFIGVTQGAQIAPGTGDPHRALAQIALALNRNSEQMRFLGGMALNMAPGVKIDPLGWLGQTVSLFADDDPFWADLAKVPDDWQKREDFFEKNLDRLPLALYCEVSNSLKLVAFLTAIHAFADQSAPDMTVWETLKYNDRSYVKVTPSDQARRDARELSKLSIYYAPAGDSIVVSLNENVIKQAMDRQNARHARDAAAPVATVAPAATTQPSMGAPFLGNQLAFRLNAQGAQVLAALTRQPYQQAMQQRAWSAIPILNEWKHRYPDQDPLKFHEKFWNIRLICPGGGSYVWNEQDQTMESTVYGHPGQPKDGPAVSAALADFKFGDFGVTFENDGLRSRLEIERGKP